MIHSLVSLIDGLARHIISTFHLVSVAEQRDLSGRELDGQGARLLTNLWYNHLGKQFIAFTTANKIFHMHILHDQGTLLNTYLHIVLRLLSSNNYAVFHALFT